MNAPKTSAEFDREFLKLLTTKEDLFWSTYMGEAADAAKLEAAEKALQDWQSNPERLTEVRAALEAFQARKATLAPKEQEREETVLKGWERHFSFLTIESEKARQLQAELIEFESQVFQARAKNPPRYVDASGQEVDTTINVLSQNLATSPDEALRKRSHDGLLQLEKFIVEKSGYLELVRRRNAFARELGYPDFFAYKVKRNEHLSVSELFSILDEFEELTRDRCFESLGELKAQKGADAAKPHNLRYSIAGDADSALSPYFPFSKALERWCASFARMGVTYRNAELTLDLLDRKGKYENGFMHGPGPAYFDEAGRWQPARVNFTSNATPSQVGSGRTALVTLFHEGGHAAHFANIAQASPCFAHEFPPMSMAQAETQSMFFDSLISDADWMTLYAKSESGESVPPELIKKKIEAVQPFMAYGERGILLVPVFERALYAMADSERTPEAVIQLARDVEKKILGIEAHPRPTLSIPHLLSDSSSCSYQGYLLAHMAVYQVRGHFLNRDGYLTDNPKIGPEMAKAAWEPGNRVTHSELLQALTGQKLSGRELARVCNRTVEQAWTHANAQRQTALTRTQAPTDGSLDARITIAHGKEVIADNRNSMKELWAKFEAWIANATVAS